MIERRTVKTWIVENRLILFGAAAGAIAGFLYWKYIGCLTGTCAITSNPLRSTIYFAVLGSLLFSLFKKKEAGKQFQNEKHNTDASS